MRLGITSGTRFSRFEDQYCTTSKFDAEFWQEALAAFDEVILLHQASKCSCVEKGFKLVLAKGISFIELPFWRSFRGLLKTTPKGLKVAYKAARKADVWLLHAPSIECMLLWPWLMLFRIPYAIELRGEQSMDITYLKLRGSRFVYLIAFILRATLWLQRARPIAVLSVSKYILDRYLPRRSCPVVVASNSRLGSEFYCNPRQWRVNDPRTIVSVARLAVEKDHEGIIRACARLDERGFKNWQLIVIGDGPLKRKLQELAIEKGLADKIKLVGFIPWGLKLFEQLRKADLFVLNTFCEGMPRSLIEAMAMALPVIGTSVGGVPELLDADDIVAPRRPDILSEKIYQVLTDPARMTRMSKRNAEKAKEYSAEVLSNRKIGFYKLLRELVEKGKN